MFDEREQSFEAGFAHEEALRFKILVRRNRLIGLWAAERLGLSGAQAEAYASALVEAQVGAANDEAMVAQLVAALAGLDPPVAEHRLRRRLAQAAAEAESQIQAGR